MHQLPLVPEEEVKGRVARFQEKLKELQLDGALITQNVDMYYLSGTMQNGVLYVPQEGEPLFYARKSVPRAYHEAVVPVEEMGRMRELGQKIEQRFGKVKRLGLETDVIPYSLAQRYISLFSDIEVVDVGQTLRMLRSIKSEYELNRIREAAKHVNEIITKLPEYIHVGMSELELAAKIEYELRVKGNSAIYHVRGYNQELFLGVVTSGENAAIPSSFDGPVGGLGLSVFSPVGPSTKPISEGDPILVDISTIVDGYYVDQTRLAVIGDLAPDLEEAYQVAVQILREVEKMGTPGTPWGDLHIRALEMAEKAGLKDYFMGYGKDQVKFLGHGIGLELDEFPILARGFSQTLEEGMVIAIEPKFIFPKRGVIGLENNYVVTKDGLKPLTIASEEIVRVPVK